MRRRQWVFGMRTYAFAGSGRIVGTWTSQGSWTLGVLEPEAKEFTPFHLPYSDYSSLRAHDGKAVFRAGSTAEGPRIVRLDLGERGGRAGEPSSFDKGGHRDAQLT